MKNFYLKIISVLILSGSFYFSFGVRKSNYLNKSEIIKQTQSVKVIYTSPLPGALYVNARSNIIIRTRELIDPASVNTPSLFVVIGSISGEHLGSIILADDQRTVIFKPSVEFKPGEMVSVKVNDGLLTNSGLPVNDTSFHFTISHNKNIPIIQKSINTNINSSFHKVTNINNLPSDFPTLTVAKSNNPSGGYIFLASYSIESTNYGRYLIIADNNGTPLYYKKESQICFDFKMQPTGLITYYYSNPRMFFGMNTSFAIVDTFTCGNGYVTDPHELRILPNGNFFIIGDDYETVNMDTVVQGGDHCIAMNIARV